MNKAIIAVGRMTGLAANLFAGETLRLRSNQLEQDQYDAGTRQVMQSESLNSGMPSEEGGACQIRNPKAESRRKSEVRKPNERRSQRIIRSSPWGAFRFRASDFLRLSAFGIRISVRRPAHAQTYGYPSSELASCYGKTRPLLVSRLRESL